MSDYWSVDIPGSYPINPDIRVRRFQNGTVQIHQANKYQGRGGKTIYLSADQFKLLRNHLIEETDGPI
jgi:hypothetical protein